MPIFEYACTSCQHRFEKLLRSSSQSVECPQCASAELQKLFSGFSSPAAGGSPEPLACPPGGCGSCPQPGFCSMN